MSLRRAGSLTHDAEGGVRPKTRAMKQILAAHDATRGAGGSKLGEGDFRFAKRSGSQHCSRNPEGSSSRGDCVPFV